MAGKPALFDACAFCARTAQSETGGSCSAARLQNRRQCAATAKGGGGEKAAMPEVFAA